MNRLLGWLVVIEVAFKKRSAFNKISAGNLHSTYSTWSNIGDCLVYVQCCHDDCLADVLNCDGKQLSGKMGLFALKLYFKLEHH